MKISFTTMATPELDIPAQFEAARAYGFDGVDLRIIERGMGEIRKELTNEEAEGILAAAEGIELPSLLCYNEKLQAGSDAMAESLLAYMELAAKLRIPSIRIFTGKVESENDMETLVCALRQALRKDRTGTGLAMQNHVNSSVTLHQALEVCRRVSDPRVSVIVSPDHAAIIGEPIMQMLPQLSRYASQLYVADADAQRKSVFPGHGTIPYDKILYSMREHGFDGYVTFKWEKCWHPELPPYDEAFRAFLSWARGQKIC